MAARDVWDNRTAFVLASIGSAIGLGNLWRFPYVCYAYGGGAFLVAYAICLVLAGILFMLGFEIHERIKAAYGDFGLRSQEFVFGWGVLILVVVGSLILSVDRGTTELRQARHEPGGPRR